MDDNRTPYLCGILFVYKVHNETIPTRLLRQRLIRRSSFETLNNKWYVLLS